MSCKSPVEKLPSGIPGFDIISHGGLPKYRTTLVSGTVGSSKTVFAAQFLAEGIRQSGESGVFVTFEESPGDIRSNLASFGWDVEAWEAEGKWIFVDASPHPEETVIIGRFDLKALLARIEHAIASVKAARISMDSLSAIITQFGEQTHVRRELFRILTALKQMKVTGVITVERMEDYGAVAGYGMEEFVADNVIILRNIRDEEMRRRTIEILKFRGTTHQKREYPFSVLPGRGIVIIPFSSTELTHKATDIRITSGNTDLDRLCGGGLFGDSIVLVSGASGTGKTLMTMGFIASGIEKEDRAVLFALEESREQLLRNARGWGIDLEWAEKEGKLMVICRYPEEATLEDHLVAIKNAIHEFQPSRLAIDSLSALERISTPRSYRVFIIGVISFLKQKGIAAIFTHTTGALIGGSSITESRISTLTDVIILLRYVELNGMMRRALTVLKMRGSGHDKNICEFTIDGQGMHVGKPFRNVTGIMTGEISRAPGESEAVNGISAEQ